MSSRRTIFRRTWGEKEERGEEQRAFYEAGTIVASDLNSARPDEENITSIGQRGEVNAVENDEVEENEERDHGGARGRGR